MSVGVKKWIKRAGGQGCGGGGCLWIKPADKSRGFVLHRLCECKEIHHPRPIFILSFFPLLWMGDSSGSLRVHVNAWKRIKDIFFLPRQSKKTEPLSSTRIHNNNHSYHDHYRDIQRASPTMTFLFRISSYKNNPGKEFSDKGIYKANTNSTDNTVWKKKE